MHKEKLKQPLLANGMVYGLLSRSEFEEMISTALLLLFLC
jgi:hypothetical protein